MRRITGLAIIIAVFVIPDPINASDRNGIYARIERVKLNNADSPDATIQVWGVFSLAKGRADYHEPQYGYMYYRLRTDAEDVCRNEWLDLKRVAGTNQLIAFGRRYGPKGREAGVGPLGTVRW